MIRFLQLALFILFLSPSVFCQIEVQVDFENFDLEPDTFLYGETLHPGFEDNDFGFLNFPHDYTAEFDSWTGWAVSTKKDTVTPGFFNQYSAITGSGVDGSDSYAVSYHFSPNVINSNIEDGYVNLKGMWITNGTYPYLSMRDGDGFAKKFGGLTGDDPDFLLLSIIGQNSDMEKDTIEVYLADFRFEDNNQDYILDEWLYVDLSGFVGFDGPALTFEFTSTDVGNYGINTPTYFCMDNLVYDVISTDVDEDVINKLSIYPNPTTDQITIASEYEGKYTLLNAEGRLVKVGKLRAGTTTTDISQLSSGMYLLKVDTQHGSEMRKIIKH